MPAPDPSSQQGRSVVAIILAIGIATAVNAITFAVCYDAIFSKGPGLSENATQVLTTAFGGFLGVLGAFVGYQAGTHAQAAQEAAYRQGADAEKAAPTEERPLTTSEEDGAPDWPSLET